MLRLISLAAFLLLSVSAAAKPGPDPERTAAMATVDAFFAAINSNDAKAIETIFLPDAQIVARRKQADGSWVVRTRTSSQDAANAAKETRRFTERYWSPQLKIHEGIATFWAPYSFDIDGKRSHCGVDLVNLVKTEAGWKISFVSYTVEPDGCPKQ